MKNKTTFLQKIMPIFGVFILVNSIATFAKNWLAIHKINADVVIGANVVLFVVSILILVMHNKAFANKNPNAVVRSMMLGTLIKLIVVASAVLIYVVMAGAKRNSYGVFCGMGLYIIYTFIEVRIATKMKKDNGNN
jgi:RsiW-degrading membrane proteinase PrsW (M82 family)